MSVENSPKNVESSAMQDADLAASLLDEVIGIRGIREPVKSMLERAYSELRKRNNAWTRRRVRAVFNKEANRIDYREIEEMRAVAEARKQHAAYREETARITALAFIRSPSPDRGLDPR
ncbi:hypothetical protein [Mesorhizobium sp. B2-5-11]|uniref:hypothetical protein n=1 Tax=Mesorhizobium sp. B2-5-11 TaxID=2589919 RepID=UPI00112C6302|nr:hypothetical protein [Mesorhizobium sp. B2-5-11]TPK14145.1 hypothetical protein FJ490_02145 [Mesorhizobium sp. B2-5-11]